MKPLSTLLALSAGVLAAATQNTAQILTFDTETSPSSSHEIETLSASTARLILSRRLGSSQFSQLGDVDESVLGQLDRFGGVQEGIFGQDAGGDVSKLLVVVEGVKEGDVDVDAKKAASGGFVVKDGSEELMQEGLVASLLGRKMGGAREECAYEFDDGEVVFDVLDTEKCVEKEAIIDQNDGKSTLNNLKISLWTGRTTTAVLKMKSQSTTALETLISDLSSLTQSSNQESTLLLLPTTTSTSTTNKLTRRQYDYTSPSAAPTGSIPSTLLPICHTSESACQSATNNCSNHGTCYKKYGSEGNADDDSGDCYACRCERTIVRKNDDGTVKTVQWGGSACQKKDVSIPFWLLAGFTVLLVAVVSWAIGLMYSVGGEELPSVIGAGVSGAKPGQK